MKQMNKASKIIRFKIFEKSIERCLHFYKRKSQYLHNLQPFLAHGTSTKAGLQSVQVTASSSFSNWTLIVISNKELPVHRASTSKATLETSTWFAGTTSIVNLLHVTLQAKSSCSWSTTTSGFRKWSIIEKLLLSEIWNGVLMEPKYVSHMKMVMLLLVV